MIQLLDTLRMTGSRSRTTFSVEHRLIVGAGAILIGDHQKVREHEPVHRIGKVCGMHINLLQGETFGG